MPATQTLIAFPIASAAIVVPPGPSNLLLLAYGIRHGRQWFCL
jgi:threonine/homoserine/homoserine lactone efflux protein